MIPRAAPPTDPRSGPRREVAARARWACAFLVGLALSGCSPLAPTPPERETDGNPEGVTVVRVIDGDTLAVEPSDTLPATNEDGTEHVVRVLGIDAPEMHYADDTEPACGAQDATDYLDELLPAGATVTLVHDSEADEVDRYGRTLAYVELEATGDIGELLVAEGYAAAWYPQSEPEPDRFPTYQDRTTEARAAGAGSWAHCTL